MEGVWGDISAFLSTGWGWAIASAVGFYTVNAEDAGLLWRAACDGADARGSSNLGFLYIEGLGVAQDYDRAANLFLQGCDGGYTSGCHNLGVMYEEGLGVAQDNKRAADLYRQLCDGGIARGCRALKRLQSASD